MIDETKVELVKALMSYITTKDFSVRENDATYTAANKLLVQLLESFSQ